MVRRLDRCVIYQQTLAIYPWFMIGVKAGCDRCAFGRGKLASPTLPDPCQSGPFCPNNGNSGAPVAFKPIGNARAAAARPKRGTARSPVDQRSY
jgi:hypothetical protein